MGCEMKKEAVKVIKEWMPELELMARYNTSSIDYQRYKALNTALEALEKDIMADLTATNGENK